ILNIENLSIFGKEAKFDWQFGEYAVPVMSTDELPNDVYFTKEGFYEVRLIVLDSCGVDTAFAQITVLPLPLAHAGPDFTICFMDGFLQQLGTESISDYEYIWS